MHQITELPAWERLLKRILWQQLGNIKGQKILDFGSGEGITADQGYGIRTFWDLQQNQEKHDDEAWQEQMCQLEMRVSQIEEYRNIAFFHHLLLRKTCK